MRSVVAVVGLLLLLLTGCTAGGSSDAAGSADGFGQDSAGASEEAMAQSDTAGSGEVGGDLGAVAADEARQVITEGTVAMTVEDPRTAVQDAAALVEQSGGRVQERVEHAGSDDRPASARLVVRVPAAGLTPVLAELERLGTVDDVQLRSTDVTGQAQDLDARIRALQISVTRLEDLLTRAESTADLVAAESSLTQRQSDLEQLQSQRARLADQVEMSTLALELRADDPTPVLEPAGFWGGLVTGWESLVTALSAALLVAGVLLPWAAVAAVLLVLWLAVRRRRRRRSGPVAPPANAPAT
ncbi:DUF4349 domain-containing protein [Cellulomonas sp. ATA003]|uniref:DUF4349 domain-containing protein n=1 Tax=Cellulomonas sp. ATA003 TaxID=3073064 RepID=UPI0028730945|nr:DUF4349 domain-containing protein [Cellulomonas sp. ATA003]WNB84427.1 DUF4349 domain-containing protein [Cellulomonas sp. ATA003]